MRNIKDLKNFGREIIELCKEKKIELMVYGSLAYCYYTKDKNMKINDIDFYVPEYSMKKVARLLTKEKIKFEYNKKWHTIIITKNNLKIEIDSYDYWYKGKPSSKNFDFYGIETKIISLTSLKRIYRIASKISNTPEKYLKKSNKLRKI